MVCFVFFSFVLKTQVLDFDTREAGTLIALVCVLIYKQDWAWPSLNPQVEASIPLPGMQSVWPTYAWTRLASVQSSLVSGHRLAAGAFTSIMISSYMGRGMVIPGNQPS